MLASLSELGLGDGEGPEDDAELTGLLDNMMNQLMTKEVLFDPLKEMEEAVSARILCHSRPLLI